jgi:hypothetical protein
MNLVGVMGRVGALVEVCFAGYVNYVFFFFECMRQCSRFCGVSLFKAYVHFPDTKSCNKKLDPRNPHRLLNHCFRNPSIRIQSTVFCSATTKREKHKKEHSCSIKHFLYSFSQQSLVQ